MSGISKLERYDFETLMDHIQIQFPYGYIDAQDRRGQPKDYLIDWLEEMSNDTEISELILQALIDFKLVWLEQIVVATGIPDWRSKIEVYCWKTPIDYDRFCNMHNIVNNMADTIGENWSMKEIMKGTINELRNKTHHRPRQ